MKVNKHKLIEIIKDHDRIIEEGKKLNVDWIILNDQETKEAVKKIVAKLYVKERLKLS